MKIFYTALVLVYAVFFLWYGGSGEPVTQAELETYVETVRKNSAERGVDPGENIEHMRTLASTDNGDEFLMVNLMKYREKALYPADSPWANDPDPQNANARYSEIIIPLLVKHGGHPVLLAPVVGTFIIEGEWAGWDDVAIVRYRSVRDMFEMIVDISQAGGAEHKWASMEQTQVFPVQATISLISVRLLVAGLLLVLALVVRGMALLFKS